MMSLFCSFLGWWSVPVEQPAHRPLCDHKQWEFWKWQCEVWNQQRCWYDTNRTDWQSLFYCICYCLKPNLELYVLQKVWQRYSAGWGSECWCVKIKPWSRWMQHWISLQLWLTSLNYMSSVWRSGPIMSSLTFRGLPIMEMPSSAAFWVMEREVQSSGPIGSHYPSNK